MRRRRWIPFLLVGVTLICFCRLFQADYSLLDDIFTVQNNPNFLPPTVKGVLSYWPVVREGSVNEHHGLYIPLTYTYWGLVATLAQTKSVGPGTLSPIDLNPYLFHTGNIVLHTLSGLLVFVILRRLLEAEVPACIGALVFLIHPVQVEAVAWISGAKDLLAGLFGLLAMWEFLRFDAATTQGARRTHYALWLLACAAAMLSKPAAITVPVVLAVINVVILRRSIRQTFIVLAPALVLAVIFGIIGALAQPATDVPPAPLWARPLIVGDALTFYLRKLILPLHLGADYGRRPAAVIGHAWFYVAWLVPALIAVLVWRGRRSQRFLFAGALIFAIAAAPTLGFTTFLFQRFSTVADHYLYLPMFGVAMCVAFVVRYKPAFVACAIALASFAVLTIVQTGVWQNDRSLFLHALEVNPRSFMAQSNLAADAMREGNIDEAEFRLQEAEHAEPFMKLSWDVLGSQLEKAKKAERR